MGNCLPPERLAVGTDEELLKVPRDVAALHRGPDDQLGILNERGRVVSRHGQRRLQVLSEQVGWECQTWCVGVFGGGGLSRAWPASQPAGEATRRRGWPD